MILEANLPMLICTFNTLLIMHDTWAYSIFGVFLPICQMATEVEVTVKKDSRKVKFDGFMKELLLAIVSSFNGVLTSVDDIDFLMVYDDEEDDYIRVEQSYRAIPNGTRFKVVLRKKVRFAFITYVHPAYSCN